MTIHKMSLRDRRRFEKSTKFKLIVENLELGKDRAHRLAALTDHVEVVPGRRLATKSSRSHGLVGLNLAIDLVVPVNADGRLAGDAALDNPMHEARLSAPWHYLYQGTACTLYSATGGSVLAYDVRHWHLLGPILAGSTDAVTPIARALQRARRTSSQIVSLEERPAEQVSDLLQLSSPVAQQRASVLPARWA